MRTDPATSLAPPPAATAGGAERAHEARRTRLGFRMGVVGMLVFAGTIPMTRLATGSSAAPALDPVFVAFGRAAVAGLLAALYLLLTRAPLPRRRHRVPLATTIAGNVVGWPVLLGLAVRHVDAMHASVITGLMPLATAVVGAWWLGQRPAPGFWAFAAAGATLVIGYAAWRGAGRLQPADLLLLGAVLASSTGYVSGVRVTTGPQALTPEQAISWVLVLALPMTLPVLVLRWPAVAVPPAAWAGFAYVAVCSAWVGFFAWYRGLAWGGTLRVSQVQLLQPFASIALAVPLLGERLDAATVGFALAIMACVFAGRRMAVAGASSALAAADPRDARFPSHRSPAPSAPTSPLKDLP